MRVLTNVVVATVLLGCSLVGCSNGGGRASDETEGELKKRDAASGQSTSADAAAADAAGDAGRSTPVGSLTIDDDVCGISAKEVAVDPLNADGWYVRVSGECNTNVTLVLTVYGMFDDPYPQTNANPWGERPATLLFWHREGTLHNDVFGSDVEGGASSITEGPNRALSGRVRGVATLANTTLGTRVVTYDFPFDR
jgi:hypothetical protein